MYAQTLVFCRCASRTNGRAFPKLAIGDDVNAQHRLVTEKFGIEKLQLLLGQSMGARQNRAAG